MDVAYLRIVLIEVRKTTSPPLFYDWLFRSTRIFWLHQRCLSFMARISARDIFIHAFPSTLLSSQTLVSPAR